MVQTTPDKSAKEIVELFLKDVRSGLRPEKAAEFMADTVLAQQVTSEKPITVYRTPGSYTDHVRSFLDLFGQYKFEVSELFAEDNKVYARWIQKGKHMGMIDGDAPTGMTLVEFTSAVYVVEKGKIVEYWLQTDRLGFGEQLKQNEAIIRSRQ